MMKKIIILFLLIIPISLFAQKELTWDFPVKPGTKEWKQTKSIEERFSICQIPENVLNTITTEKLLKLCIDFPLYATVLSQNNFIQGLRKLEKRFNGLAELASRNDQFEILFSKYKQLKIPSHELSFYQQRDLVDALWRLEILILYCVIKGEGNKSIPKKFLAESYYKYKAKKAYPEIFTSYSYQLPLYILAKSIADNYKQEFKLLSKENDELKDFLETCKLKSEKTENEILVIANNYVN